MCVIIDANLASRVFSDPAEEHFSPVIDWLVGGGGELVIGGRLATELDRLGEPRRFVRALLRAGRARLIPETEIAEEEVKLETTGLCVSNDLHVLGLVRASGARTVCTLDKALQRDVRNRQLVSNPRGSVYTRQSHRHLLKHTASCGRLPKRRR
ncbi:MAG: hypothetical protein JF614_31075 [Acidobacteria bacterium]|nr:hypothetical protein [Acidobacteriota bacterium]